METNETHPLALNRHFVSKKCNCLKTNIAEENYTAKPSGKKL